MSLDEYSSFIHHACFLNDQDPQKSWENLSKQQEAMVDVLNKGRLISFKSDHVDISFSINNRTWINSDGKRNMPSGEVFTSPVEDSGEGEVSFSYPSLLFGEVIEGLT